MSSVEMIAISKLMTWILRFSAVSKKRSYQAIGRSGIFYFPIWKLVPTSQYWYFDGANQKFTNFILFVQI